MHDKRFKAYIQNNYYDLIFYNLKSFIIGNRSSIKTFSRIIPDPSYYELTDFQIMGITFMNNEDDHLLLFKVSVYADIIIKGWSNSTYKSDIAHQWFSLSFSSILQNGLKNVRIENIEFYTQDNFHHEEVLSRYLIPYIKSEDLDKIATKFLTTYCIEALKTPMPIPVESIVDKMGLKMISSNLDDHVFGQIFFNDAYIKSTDDDGNTCSKHIKSGSILINERTSFMTSVGTKNNTIIHECIHWYLHHRFFELQRVMNSNLNYLSCEVIDEPNYSHNNTDTAISWMEWQANSIAPKILIPHDMGKQKLNELMRVISADNPNARRAVIMEQVIYEFAQFFKVSNTIAKIRAIDLGFTQAIGTFNFVNGIRIPPFTFDNIELARNQTFLIDIKNVLQLSAKCRTLKEDLYSRRFIHVQGFIVINDPKYVTFEERKGAKLTEYALDHIDECCYLFSRLTTVNKNYDDSYYSLCYLSRDIDSKYYIEATFDFEDGNNRKVQADAYEVEKTVIETEQLINILTDLPNSFCKTLDIHINRKNYTNEKLEELSHVSERTIRNYRKDPNVRPSLKTVLALCIGLNLHPMLMKDLITKAGHDIYNQVSKENGIYIYLINNHHMATIDMWNDFLEKAKLNTLEKNNKKTEV